TAGEAFTFWDSPIAMQGLRLMLRDDLEQAREILEAKEALLSSDVIRAAVRRQLVTLEGLSGRWARALDHAGAAAEVAEDTRDDHSRSSVLQAAALVEAHLGLVEEARAKAGEAFRLSTKLSDEITAIESRAVLGHIELARGDHRAAAESLRELPD